MALQIDFQTIAPTIQMRAINALSDKYLQTLRRRQCLPDRQLQFDRRRGFKIKAEGMLPGAGTSVTLSVPLDDEDDEDSANEDEDGDDLGA